MVVLSAADTLGSSHRCLPDSTFLLWAEVQKEPRTDMYVGPLPVTAVPWFEGQFRIFPVCSQDSFHSHHTPVSLGISKPPPPRYWLHFFMGVFPICDG